MKLSDLTPFVLEKYPRQKVITKNAATCPACGDTVESKSRHDFASCSCGGISVDGGLDYTRRVWHNDLINGKMPIEASEYRDQTDEEYFDYVMELIKFSSSLTMEDAIAKVAGSDLVTNLRGKDRDGTSAN